MEFFPADLAILDFLRTPAFLLRQVREAEAAIDYEAFTTCPDVIRIYSGGQ